MHRPLVFVDLETTGATAASDRITEIGIVEVNAEGVSEWSTLVNPETHISGFIERLTGISNAMVANAPTFANLAEEVMRRLQGRVFVAHNAAFDYGFLKSELKCAGYDFRATVLCTVKLSRKLYPQHHRHSLDALIERYGLKVADRHRALGDARLIWQFWQVLHREYSAEQIEAAVAQLTAPPSLPPQLDARLVDELPQGHGVYFFYGNAELPLYIGKANNLKKRVLSQLSADHGSTREMSLQVRRVEWIETGGELGALLKESALVKQFQPTHNRRLRRNHDLCTWSLVVDAHGVLRPNLAWVGDVDMGRQDRLFGPFKSRREAVNVLTAIADEHGLCHVVLGLERVDAGKPCSAYPLQKCRGACIGEEQPAAHNLRLLKALARLKVAVWPWAGAVGVREGEDLHVLDAWRHLGTARSEAEAWAFLDSARPDFDFDVYKILRKSLPGAAVIPLFKT